MFLEHLPQNILKSLTYVEFYGGDTIHFGVSSFLLNSHMSLSLFSPLMKALFIESCLHRPKFDKETLKGSQPLLLQTIIELHPNSVTTPEIHDDCAGSLMLCVT